MSITFQPSGTPVQFTPVPETPTVASMPAVDAGNVATTVANNTASPIWLAFGDGTFMQVGPAVPGNVSVLPGGVVLLTSNPGPTASAYSPPRIVGDPAASAAAAATIVTVATSMLTGGTVVITRGTARSDVVF